jgi:hypothetical protein
VLFLSFHKEVLETTFPLFFSSFLLSFSPSLLLYFFVSRFVVQILVALVLSMDAACDVPVLFVLASFAEGEEEENEAAAASTGWLLTASGSEPSQACFHVSRWPFCTERGEPRRDMGE